MRLREKVKLGRYTTWGIGGAADFLAEPADEHEFAEAVKFARSNSIPIFVMGSGSNLLVHDDGVEGLVIRTVRLNQIVVDGVKVVADAGVKLPRLARLTSEMGLSGLEELAGIPGTVGGALVQNAGAYGREFGEIVEWVEVLTDGGIERIDAHAIKFFYRKTILPVEGFIIRLGLKLAFSDRERVVSRLRELLVRRHQHQPRGKTAGSVFKNPANHRPAGWLLDRAGMKGVSVGGAMFSTLHANFIVNTGNASASDIFELIKLGRERVYAIFGVKLELEIKLVGDFKWPESGEK